MTQKFYPSDKVSQSLDPSQRGFKTIVGRHDRRITDADINLIQDLQDQKRRSVLDNKVFSGCLGFRPFIFSNTSENSFIIPAFDLMFNGEVVSIGGSNSRDLSLNKVKIPQPVFWNQDQTGSEARVFVTYLELWYTVIDPESGSGYYVDSTGARFLYANGCLDCDRGNLIPDDLIDPFEGLMTTGRVQTQWAIRTASLPLTYDFDLHPSGLDKGVGVGDAIYGQALLSQQVSVPGYEFKNLGPITGDYGLWRSGENLPYSSLVTLDGYSYAVPLGVSFQRNTGPYAVDVNPFGCSDPNVQNSGLLRYGVSGRPDGKYADVAYEGDVVDTRMTVSISEADPNSLLNKGFTDLVVGSTRLKVSRGDGVGCKSIALGSSLPFSVSIGSTGVTNTNYLGSFDGYMNGFSLNSRITYSTFVFTLKNKTQGINGQRWAIGDVVSLQLSPTLGPQDSNFHSVVVQSIVTKEDGSSSPALLFKGQTEVTGLGQRSISIRLTDLAFDANYDPAINPLVVTVGVEFLSGSKYNLGCIPFNIPGGKLNDPIQGELSVFSVSDYAIKKLNSFNNLSLLSYNPSYSSSVFGTRAFINVPSSAGVRTTSGSVVTTTFSIPYNSFGSLKGVYVVSAKDALSGRVYTVSNRSFSGTNMTVSLLYDFSTSPSLLSLEILCTSCAQLSFNAPTQGVSFIEETVLIGSGMSDLPFSSDSRLKILDTNVLSSRNEILLSVNGGKLKGISGDSTGVRQIFISDLSGVNFSAYPVSSVTVNNGVITLVIPNDSITLTDRSWFVVASFFPSFSADSSLILTSDYIPYQGEGVADREYSIIYSEDEALVTTNGTGSSPIVGLKDIFPFNRELPIVTSLPSISSWGDSDLSNQAISVSSDSNYEAKQALNVEHTVRASLHSNDFIEPITGWRRKTLKMHTPGNRGFSRAYPHVGFAIPKPKTKTVLGDSLLSTTASITLYVNNISGSDANSGLSSSNPLLSIRAALLALPPVLRHPVDIVLVDTGTPYSLVEIQADNSISAVVMGNGSSRPVKYYVIGNLSFEIQSSGRLNLTREPNSTSRVQVNALGYSPYGDGPVGAFFIENSRVMFSGIQFSNFIDPVIRVENSDVEFVDCSWDHCLQSVSASEGSTIVLSGGELDVPNGGNGVVLSSSNLSVFETYLRGNTGMGSFFVAERGSNITLHSHALNQESGITSSTSIALSRINSSISCLSGFVTNGGCVIQLNSVLVRSVSVSPFLGNVTVDVSSSITTDIG